MLSGHIDPRDVRGLRGHQLNIICAAECRPISTCQSCRRRGCIAGGLDTGRRIRDDTRGRGGGGWGRPQLQYAGRVQQVIVRLHAGSLHAAACELRSAPAGPCPKGQSVPPPARAREFRTLHTRS